MSIKWEDIYIDKKKSNYQVSSNGDVRNKDGKILSPYMINSGYLCIKLSMNGIKYPLLIHRLVATAFIPNPENKPDVNHKDTVKTHNWVSNLEWCTKNENMQHASLNDLLSPKIGSDSPFAKHTEAQIHKACELLENGKFSLSDISNMTGVSINTLQGIRHRGKWSSISSQYNIQAPHRNSWSEETNAAIQILRNQGYTYRQCLERIGLPVTDANELRCSRLMNKVKDSTTIPWVVFEFTSINQQE